MSLLDPWTSCYCKMILAALWKDLISEEATFLLHVPYLEELWVEPSHHMIIKYPNVFPSKTGIYKQQNQQDLTAGIKQ